jgi:hypothetical protein
VFNDASVSGKAYKRYENYDGYGYGE